MPIIVATENERRILQEKIEQVKANLQAEILEMGKAAVNDTDLPENHDFMARRTKVQYEIPTKLRDLLTMQDSIQPATVNEGRFNLGDDLVVEITDGSEVETLKIRLTGTISSLFGDDQLPADRTTISNVSPLGLSLLTSEKKVGTVSVLPNGTKIKVIGIGD